ncbi:MAG: electron transport complex subunit RsxC [Peptococcaceae bacterium]|nr:electron transport complex subunit RsxC [Peptococcaceae bacterium]
MWKLKSLTFSGGIHPLAEQDWKAATKASPLRVFAPASVVIPMRQHLGRPCAPCVKPGDEVLLGQMIGEPASPRDVPVHASVSGKVVAVEERPHVTAGMMLAVVIENDGQDKPDPSIQPRSAAEVEALRPEQLRDIIRDAGIVGMGGAEFPTHLKLDVKGKVDYLLINGAECEPSLTGDHRQMLENGDLVVKGAVLLMRACGAKECVIGIEGKPDAAEAIQKAAEGAREVRVLQLKVKYPQGAEKMLIASVTGRKVPAGGLPAAVGCVVDNVSTAVAVAEAVYEGAPLTRRSVTVNGAVGQPGNLLLRIGTTFRDAVNFCGGFVGTPQKIISGGPMMGTAVAEPDVPVTKGGSGITVFNQITDPVTVEGNCLRCGRCVEACPLQLTPQAISEAYLAERLDLCGELRADLCMKCGCCTFVCPAKRHLSQTVDLAKRALAAQGRR